MTQAEKMGVKEGNFDVRGQTTPTVVAPAVNLKELAAKGEAVYEQLKERLEKEHYGKFIAIEPESSDYEIADRSIGAFLRLKERWRIASATAVASSSAIC